MCAACALPPAVRAELRRLHMRGTSLREIAAVAGSKGYPVGRDTLHRHIREHLAPVDDEETTGDSFEAALAVAVATGLRGWHGLAEKVAHALDDLGAHDAALIVQAVVPETMQKALKNLPTTSPARELLEAQCLARAVNRVLSRPSPAHAALARDLHDALRDEGADDLADAFLDVVERASRLSVGEGDESPSDSQSRSGAVAPPAAGSRPGPPSTTSTKESA